jgi:nucleoside 2-deoxyribosyltransferase
MRRVYVASPLGFAEPTKRYYSETLLPTLGAVVVPVDPWSLMDPARVAELRASEGHSALARAIGRLNIDAIRGCAGLVAILDGQEADSGTVAELGYAAGLGLPCFGLRSDMRTMGEPGTSVSLQVEAFIEHSGGSLHSSLSDLVESLRLWGLGRASAS